MIASQIVLAALRVHPERATSQSELAKLADCSERMVRKAVSDLRRQGWLVVKDVSGYRFARNADEVNQVIVELERQAHSLQEIRRALVEAAQQQFGSLPGEQWR